MQLTALLFFPAPADLATGRRYQEALDTLRDTLDSCRRRWGGAPLPLLPRLATLQGVRLLPSVAPACQNYSLLTPAYV